MGKELISGKELVSLGDGGFFRKTFDGIDINRKVRRVIFSSGSYSALIHQESEEISTAILPDRLEESGRLLDKDVLALAELIETKMAQYSVSQSKVLVKPIFINITNQKPLSQNWGVSKVTLIRYERQKQDEGVTMKR